MAEEYLPLVDRVIADLTEELNNTDEDFNSALLISKVRSDFRELVGIRKYPTSYTAEMINRDMERYYSVLRNLALYDYGQTGFEGQKMHQENGISMTYVSRNSILSDVLPLSRT